MTKQSLNKICCIGYACGDGTQNKHCQDAPFFLRQRKVESVITQYGIDAEWVAFSVPNDEAREKRIRSAGLVLYRQIQEALESGAMPLLFGGDHSMAAFSWQAITDYYKLHQQYGLIWFDAHIDAHIYKTSPSQNPHGMPVAHLIGAHVPIFSDIGENKTSINPKHIHQIGIRRFEAGEHQLAESKGVEIHYMKQIQKDGLELHFNQALKSSLELPSFGISIDIDAFDPKEAPGTGTIADDGLRTQDVFPLLQGLAHNPKLSAIEIAEFNPHLDIEERTFALIKNMLDVLFAPPRNLP